MQSSLVLVAEKVHEALVNPPEGISNVTEWAKKDACWDEICKLKIDWPSDFVDRLISADDKEELDHSARKDQKVLSGIEAQTTAVNAGPEFWERVAQWGRNSGFLSPWEDNFFNSVTKGPSRMYYTEPQSKVMMKVYYKLREEGFNEEIALKE